ncbi:chalcone isomerase family protein [Acidovorax sp. Leaf78]|uniref:chalcone isomerase family protein n=1 Tax=Acidovorax sp. Leaf78 TaxID=1736237 RepID=UPI0009E6FB45|nr:chalcone isomerase family protein [Acidovorax sp. Leaf78]
MNAIKNIALAACLASGTAIFYTQPLFALEAEAAGPLSGARLVGQGTLSFLGFDVYRARLWAAPGFDSSDYAAHPLALELTYHRGFSADAIAKRSLDEMRRVGSFTPEQAARWQQALQAALPDVKPGDRLLGVYQPGAGAVFRMGGRVVGEVPDAEFARLFFGIWLSPKTSEPALRQALIASPRNAGSPP